MGSLQGISQGTNYQFHKQKNKKQKTEIYKLEKQIKSLKIDINNKVDPEKHKRLLILRMEYNKLTSD